MDAKPAILHALNARRLIELANKQPFKARAYDAVIKQIHLINEPIHSMEQLAGVKGIGEKIREKLEEIIATGKLKSVERDIDRISAHETLQGIYGIGPAKATALIEQGIRSIAELRQRTDLLNDKQRIGLQYYEDLLQRIPREEMVEHDALLRECAHPSLPIELVGSYRRGALNSGDIDVLIRVPPGYSPKDIHTHFYDYIQTLRDRGYVEEILALGEHKCMAICRLPNSTARRLDLLVTPDEEYACALLYFTGSDRFNVAFRQHALSKGYTLNEHALQQIQPNQHNSPNSPNPPNPPIFRTEDALFRFLGLQYTPPNERVDGSSLRVWTIRRPQFSK